MALAVTSGASVSAAAYHLPADQLSTTGLPAGYIPPCGGTITLSAAADLTIGEGAVLDVSGSEPVDSLRLEADGVYRSGLVAGNPGSLNIEFGSQFQLNGELRGAATLRDMPGGSLSLKKTDILTAYQLRSEEIENYLRSGFDDITLASFNELRFSESLETNLARKLTLDAPVISASGQSVSLNAPWIVLTNTYQPPDRSPVREPGTLNLSGGWIDIQGEFILTGFDKISLEASHHIRLADHLYNFPSLPDEWRGRMATEADLIFNADRVYPTTQSIFSIITGGDAVTLSTSADPYTDPVYSAGGYLALEAANIHHMGRWYAPMGQLRMTSVNENGRIYLDSGSLLSTTGDAPVNYGGLDDDAIVWLALDKSSNSQSPSTEVQQAPEAAVVLDVNEVIMRDGARVDVSGGGDIFAYRFLPGVEGSTDPFKKAGRMVIVPGMTDVLPGQALHLEGNALVDKGVYTVLPESYAFLPGALIVEDMGPAATADSATKSNEGYAVTVGHSVVPDTSLKSSQSHFYTVRPASEVVSEGNFTIKQMTVGDAGTFDVKAETTILNGSLNASPLDGYLGGNLSLSGKNINAGTTGAQLPDGFFYESPTPEELAGRLIINAAAISDGEFNSVSIGDSADTEQIVIEAGSTLKASNITISAVNSIQVGDGSLISADGQQSGVLSLNSPQGRVSIGSSSIMHAAHDLQINSRQVDLKGDIDVDNSSLHMVSERIFVVEDDNGAEGLDGLVINKGLWEKIGGIDTLGLESMTDIVFMGDFNLQAADALILDSDRIVLEGASAAQVTVAASIIHLQNTSLTGEAADGSSSTAISGTGSIDFNADDVFVHFGEMADLGASAGTANNLLIDGAAETRIRSAQSVVLSGVGSLMTDGDLSIESAGITTALSETTAREISTSFATADVKLLTSSGSISTLANGNSWAPSADYGGKVTFQGRSIDHAGLINSPSGTIHMIAAGGAGGDGIILRGGSNINVSGTDHSAGGAVILETGQGDVQIEAGAAVDVSAGNQGDAGKLSIAAPEAAIQILGDLHGLANGGTGGDFSLDAQFLGDFGTIADRLTSGGFNSKLDFRARQGDVVVAVADSLAAQSIKIVADNGGVDVLGALDVTGMDNGGALEIYAGNDVHLSAGSNLKAGGAQSGSPGGKILLSAQDGTIRFDSGARIEVGGTSGAQDGIVHLRSLRDGSTMRMDLNGEISGASAILAEGVAVYDGIASVLKSGLVGDSDVVHMDTVATEAVDWINALDFQHQLPDSAGNVLRIVPGIEIRSDADLAVKEVIDFSAYAADLPVGVLTLRSTGNLAIEANIIDARTSAELLRDKTAESSWALNLSAGADLASSDPLAVFTTAASGSGQLITDDSVLIYTENAPIYFASAGNTEFGLAGRKQDPMTFQRMKYNIGSFKGSVFGSIGGDLSIEQGALQTATGDIRLQVKGDLILSHGGDVGSIRTIGEAPEPGDNPREQLGLLWEYANGGDIALDVDGAVRGMTDDSDAWDGSLEDFYFPVYSGGGIKGIAAMAGGDLSIRAGGDVVCTAGTFGRGDLTIGSGGNLDGRFLIRDGKASLNAFENFGMLDRFDNQPIEAFAAEIELVAQGSIELGTVLNPTIANKDIYVPDYWNLGYTEDSAVSLKSLRGDVSITGQTRYYSKNLEMSRLLPATLDIDAANDIILGGDLYMAPSTTGNLALKAGGSIHSETVASGIQPRYSLSMSDQDPSLV
ncbi:MAG: hypothetical protein PVJ19_15740, partial [Desulfobacteraceae bacterium]